MSSAEASEIRREIDRVSALIDEESRTRKESGQLLFKWAERRDRLEEKLLQHENERQALERAAGDALEQHTAETASRSGLVSGRKSDDEREENVHFGSSTVLSDSDESVPDYVAPRALPMRPTTESDDESVPDFDIPRALPMRSPAETSDDVCETLRQIAKVEDMAASEISDRARTRERLGLYAQQVQGLRVQLAEQQNAHQSRDERAASDQRAAQTTHKQHEGQTGASNQPSHARGAPGSGVFTPLSHRGPHSAAEKAAKSSKQAPLRSSPSSVNFWRAASRRVGPPSAGAAVGASSERLEQRFSSIDDSAEFVAAPADPFKRLPFPRQENKNKKHKASHEH